MSWITTLLKEVFVDSDPDKERKSMSPRQIYDYLISKYSKLTPSEMAQLKYLHKELGIKD